MRRWAGLGLLVWMGWAAAAVAQKPAGGWWMQDFNKLDKVTQSGEKISTPGFKMEGWYPAVVPGTALTTLVKAGVYPEPLYGENNRPEKIPETLARTSWWYRGVMPVPAVYAGKRIWLNFDGVNYAAEVWVNGDKVGEMHGAFARGRFDITESVRAGRTAYVAVLVTPQPHPGEPHEHTIRAGMGRNGGVTALDGPTFLSTIGWDWLPAIRDRDTGIWQKVYLSATRDVRVEEPLVTTTLPLPKTDSADVAVKATVENVSDAPVKGVLRGSIGTIRFEREVTVEAGGKSVVSFEAKDKPVLHMKNPKLWWPNGYGPQNLYKLHLEFVAGAQVSDATDVTFGVRQIQYSLPGNDNLAISVNGVPVFIRGGDWGLDEGMKRIPRKRLEAQIRMHALANMNMIRNWVGQSTGEDFYELCDKYGILLWDEFFQPNPGDGPNPEDFATYMANAREKIVRFRNHPSIAVWCGRNEGAPPKEINDALQKLMDELEPVRRYQPSSTDGAGVRSGGPYMWRTPQQFYQWKKGEVFKTEIGSVSIPTLESVHGMMPEKDWETINDDWAEHDFAKGASGSDSYKATMESRYGKVLNLPDFVRKGQMMNFEAFRAMYEGRQTRMFLPGDGASESSTGVITWMSHPAQPSFVWQLYHYDLEPNSALYAVKSASEPVHVQLNEATGEAEVINHTAAAVKGSVRFSSFSADGLKMYEKVLDVKAAASSVQRLGQRDDAGVLAPIHFVELELMDGAGKIVSRNVYWRGTAEHPDDLTGLEALPVVQVGVKVSRRDVGGTTKITATLKNATDHVALMTHLQLRRKSGERVLPVFANENYVSLMPGEEVPVVMEFATKELKGESVVVIVDGWNVTVKPVVGVGVAVKENVEAQVAHWPVTGLPVATEGLR